MILGFSRGGGVGLWVPKCLLLSGGGGGELLGGGSVGGGALSACVVTPMLVSDPSPVALILWHQRHLSLVQCVCLRRQFRSVGPSG